MRSVPLLSIFAVLCFCPSALAEPSYYFCTRGEEIPDFRPGFGGAGNYLHPLLIDSAYRSGQASFAISEGAQSTVTRVKVLNFDDQSGALPRSWHDVELGFTPTAIQLVPIRLRGSTQTKMVLLAQHPSTQAVSLSVLDQHGAQSGPQRSWLPTAPVSGQATYGKFMSITNNSDGSLRAIALLTKFPASPDPLMLGAMVCNWPELDTSAANQNRLICRDRNGAEIAPTFYPFGTWTTPHSRHEFMVEGYVDDTDEINFAMVDFRSELRVVHGPLISTYLALPNSSDMNALSVRSGGSSSNFQAVLSYSRDNGSFGSVYFGQRGFSRIDEQSTDWYRLASSDILQPKWIDTQTELLDEDANFGTMPASLYRFQSGTPYFYGELKGLHVQGQKPDKAGVILDNFSFDVGDPRVTYQRISAGMISRVTPTSSIVVYVRTTSQSHLTAPNLPKLLLWSMCTEPNA